MKKHTGSQLDDYLFKRGLCTRSDSLCIMPSLYDLVMPYGLFLDPINGLDIVASLSTKRLDSIWWYADSNHPVVQHYK